MQWTISAGDMSLTNCHSGLPAVFAHRSHTALTTAAVARWTTPFSGPSHRIWLSPVISRQNVPKSSTISGKDRCWTKPRNDWTAAAHSSVPRPSVNARPWPLLGSVRMQRDIGGRVVRVGIHRVRTVPFARSGKTNVLDFQVRDRRGHRRGASPDFSFFPADAFIQFFLPDESKLRAKKRPPEKLGSQGGLGHRFLSGSDWTLRGRWAGKSVFEADDGFLAERSLRGPQSPKTPGADSTTWILEFVS